MVTLDVLIVNVNLEASTTQGCEAIASRLRALRPGLRVEIVHWLAHDLRKQASRAQGVVLGPNETPFPAYPEAFQQLLGWVREQEGPLLGICGGHQVLALAHGASVGPVHDVPPATSSYGGMPKVTGATRARLTHADPLTRDLPEEIAVASSHVDEVKHPPEGFRLVVSGELCRVQMIAHVALPIWGAQFHPEREAPGDAGTRILERWLGALRP